MLRFARATKQIPGFVQESEFFPIASQLCELEALSTRRTHIARASLSGEFCRHCNRETMPLNAIRFAVRQHSGASGALEWAAQSR